MSKDQNNKKTFLVLYKNKGKFYTAYGIDAYILNFLFNYKVLDNHKCGFPDTAFTKVINKLEDEKISYEVVYLDKDPLKKDYRILNKYEKYVTKAHCNMDIKNKVEIIVQKIKMLDKQELERVLEILANV